MEKFPNAGGAGISMNTEILIYSTRFCPYCIAAKYLLSKKGVAFTNIDLTGNRALRQEMTEASGRHTVPQIWIGDRHIGGYDDLADLEYDGELDMLLGLETA
jgi:glutaredoxin 3